MRVLITGGAGFLGQKLARELLERGEIALKGGWPQKIDQLVLFDKTSGSQQPSDPRVQVVEGDICHAPTLQQLLRPHTDLIFHLAAVVSGEAEKDFELGMEVNLGASMQLLELCRQLTYTPVLVFASSCAVYGGALTDTIDDRSAPLPQSSYGTQKAMVDLMINDYSRRGFIDGRALRLPTIAIRPGSPNAATSSFVSSIIREPINGQTTNCPVDGDTKVWLLSPKKVIENFIHAAQMETSAWGRSRIVNLPGITTTIAEMVHCLEVIRGKEATRYIQWQPDPFIQSIVLTWPPSFDVDRALSMGFQKDPSVSDIIQSYLDEQTHD